MELKELFRMLSERAASDGWEPVLHYLYRPGQPCMHYPSEEPLPDAAYKLLHRIEYAAVPLVAMNTETENALRTQRLVYHPDTETYYYGVVTEQRGELDCVVCWYAVPTSLNDTLETWLKRYWSTRDTERFLDELILMQNQ
jgi:hypothetical protein